MNPTYALVAALCVTACSTAAMNPPPARDAAADASPDVPTAPTDGGDEFAGVPTCTVSGFMNLQGALHMNEPIPSAVIAAGRPTLTQTAGPSSLALTDGTGASFLLRFEWNGTLRADQSADLTGAQLFFPMDQGPSAPPLDGPWADRRVCAGTGSRIMMRQTGMQFILRNWTITTGACPGGDSGADEVRGCYVPNVAP